MVKQFAIILDMDDTLYDQRVPFHHALSKYVSYPIDKLDELFIAHRKYSDEVFEASQNGEITMEEMYIYRLKYALLEQNITISDETALAIQSDYAQELGRIQMDEWMIALLDLAKAQGVQIGMITNGPTAHQWRKLTQLNVEKWIPKSYILVSQEVQAAKPYPAIFEMLETRMGLDKTQMYYIGDSYHNDVVGATQADWKAIWLNTYNKPKGTITPYYTVTSRKELYDYVKALIEAACE